MSRLDKTMVWRSHDVKTKAKKKKPVKTMRSSSMYVDFKWKEKWVEGRKKNLDSVVFPLRTLSFFL